jgi:hypothetical protein
MITWLASYPRSGNTFARIALHSLFGINSRTIYPVEDDARTIDLIIGKHLPDLTSSEMAESPEQCFAKTHELPDDRSPAIYLVRDGRDVLVSYAHFIVHEEFGVGEKYEELFLATLEKLIIGKERFGGWSSHVLAWTHRGAPTCMIRFEDLIAGPRWELRKALMALGQLPSIKEDAPLPGFGDMHQTVPWFFRNGKAGAWETEMPAELQGLFWKHHGAAMRFLGYADATEGSNVLGTPDLPDLAGRDEIVIRLEADLAGYQRLVTERDRQIAQLEATAAQRLGEMVARDNVIDQLKEVAAERLEEMQRRDAVIDHLRIAAAERLSGMLARDEVIAELKGVAAERLREMEVRERGIAG